MFWDKKEKPKFSPFVKKHHGLYEGTWNNNKSTIVAVNKSVDHKKSTGNTLKTTLQKMLKGPEKSKSKFIPWNHNIYDTP